MRLLLSFVLFATALSMTWAQYQYQQRSRRQFPGPWTRGQRPHRQLQGSCRTFNGPHGKCRPPAQCSLFYDDLVAANVPPCQLEGGASGLCCPDPQQKVPDPGTATTGFGNTQEMNTLGFRISDSDANAAVQHSETVLSGFDQLENRLLQNNRGASFGSSAFQQHLFFVNNPGVAEKSRIAIQQLEASKDLHTRLSIPANTAIGANNLAGLQGSCPPTPQCNARSKYRTFDGSCNNLANPKWGQAQTAYERILLPEYADGIWQPRSASSVTGQPLPNPRVISTTVTQDGEREDPFNTVNIMVFGQFIDHDFSQTPNFQFDNGTGISCCTAEGDFLPANATHFSCLPIAIPGNDRFYRQFNRRCMDFVRSRITPRSDCMIVSGEQMNQLSHFIDGSMIYGSSTESARALREGNGRLRVSTTRNSVLPPLERDGQGCFDVTRSVPCLEAGDTRIHEQPGLTTLHVVWLREHNRIAGELQRLNPGWNDETLFQETRRIVIAELQHITYNEFLPVLLGRRFMELYSMLVLQQGHYEHYSPDINPSINNEFAAAAYRLHSMVAGMYRLLNDQFRSDESVRIHDVFFNNRFSGRPELVDRYIRGMSSVPNQQVDRFFTDSLTTQLFRSPTEMFGFDLVALNIQRGRDHGIPSYTKYREECLHQKARSFGDLRTTHPNDVISALQRVYQHVDDIDLFVGLTTERPHPSSLLGPTMLCLVGDQFARLRRGDRFFYDNANQPHSFTLAQLQEIRKSSLARIYCDNGDNIEAMQPQVFRLTNEFFNQRLPCDSPSIPRVNLNPWAGERVR